MKICELILPPRLCAKSMGEEGGGRRKIDGNPSISLP